MKKNIALLLGFLLSITMIPANETYAQDQKEKITGGLSYYGMRAAVDPTTGLMGYVDEEGDRISQFIYTNVGEFINGIGMATIETGENKGTYAINTKGEAKKFNPTLGSINYYDGTFGVVSIPSNNPLLPIKSALIDKDGTLITKYDYDGISVNYIKNTHEAVILAYKGEKSGVIDRNGKVIIPIEYDSIQWFPTYPGIFSVGKQVSTGKFKYGYIRSNGQVLLECVYDSAAEFEEGYGRVEKSGKWAVVNSNGTLITDFIYDRLDAYSEGIAAVQKNGKFGCIDTNGNLVIPLQYDDMVKSENGNINFNQKDGAEKIFIKNPLIEKRSINIYLNGKWIYSDQEPVIRNDRTLAPFRAIAEALGYAVEWDGSSQSVVLQNSQKIIHLKVGSDEAIVNTFDDGKTPETITLDVPVNLINGRILVPVRFLAENIGAEVTWNQVSKTIDIKTN